MTGLVDNVWNFPAEVDKWKLIRSTFLLFLTLVLIRFIVRKRSVMSRIKKKQEHLQEARSRLRDRVRTCPPLSHLDKLDAPQVQQRLQANEMTSLEALRLYQKRVVDASVRSLRKLKQLQRRFPQTFHHRFAECLSVSRRASRSLVVIRQLSSCQASWIRLKKTVC
uniref:Transmembrane protein n=1 Tax=Mesocestoides corti TaxID=53468 RepID=A0A5K3FYT1_MESCO